MFDLGSWLMSIFGAEGGIAIAIIVFVIFFIDAMIFPTLPEVFFVIALSYKPEWTWALELLLIAAVAEMLGMIVLYEFVEHIRVPRLVQSAVGKYVNFLIVPDERMVLINRFVPLLPFTGAIASIAKWELRKVIIYNFVGCLIKYGLLAFVGGAIMSIIGPDGGMYTLILVIAMLVISGIYTYRKKKKKEAESENENC